VNRETINMDSGLRRNDGKKCLRPNDVKEMK
jgi:hypothetical protein